MSTDTSVNNNSSDDITQVEVHQEQHDTHDVVDSDAAKQQRNIVVTETIMQQFLDKIGIDHFPDFDHYHPGLTWTDKGYIYNLQLMTASQSRSLNRFVMQIQNEPTYFKKLLNKVKKSQNCVKAAIAFMCTTCKGQLLFALLQLITFVCTTAIDNYSNC